MIVPEHVPAVAGSNFTPCNEKGLAPLGPSIRLFVVPKLGVRAAVKFTFWLEIALLALGNVPTAWLGKPFAINDRAVALQAQLHVDVRIPEVLYVL